jgi:hypothetical protein
MFLPRFHHVFDDGITNTGLALGVVYLTPLFGEIRVRSNTRDGIAQNTLIHYDALPTFKTIPINISNKKEA